MKIAYFGYDLFYPCLKKILEDKNIEVLKVFSFPENEDDKNENVKKLAKENSIDFTEKKVEKEDINALEKRGCDLIVCAGYLYKIPIENMDGINIHPSLLPIGRGAWPMPVTILKGLEKTGLTVHKLTDNFDDGKILASKCHQMKKNENLEMLNEWILNNCADLMYDCVVNYQERLKTAKVQAGGEYWKLPDKKEMTIGKDSGFDEADRISRAFYGSGFFWSDGEKLIKIKRGFVSREKDKNFENYEIKDGYLVVLEKVLNF